MRIYHHVYKCELCNVIFGVEEAYEEQPAAVCPVCSREGGLEHLGCNEIFEVYEPSKEE